MNQKAEGQLRHIATGAGGILIGLGILAPEDSITLTDALMAAVGAVLTLAGHVRSLVTK